MNIHEAAMKGDQEAILSQLESGVSVDALDSEGRTPLMLAARSKQSDVETIQLLLDKGANPNAIGGEYPTPVLLTAIGFGDLARVQCLLDAGADVNLVVEGSLDALTCVASSKPNNRSLSMVELLLEYGASLDYEDNGQTALTSAFDVGNFDIVRRLLESGADESQLEWTPLVGSIVVGTVDDVREQLEHGADLEFRDYWEDRTPWLLSVMGGNIEKAELLLAAGANCNEVAHMGKTALMYSIEANNPEMLKWLLSVGCDVNAAGEFGETALMKAAQENSAPLVQILLEAGADPNKVARIFGSTIEFTTSIEVVNLLLAAGQDINDASTRTRELLFGIGHNDGIVVSRDDCDAGAQPRLGTANPEKMNVPLWNAMALTGESFEARRALFANYDGNLFWENCVGTYPFEKYPLWFYPRYGMSLTALPDGRFIEIGGYYEEGGNPNFCIYNEVFVRYPNQKLDIYGYPAEVFPPTDGHSATLVGEYIYIIGCIGHPDDRIVGYTPVYRLNTRNFVIEKVETSGDNPGWIFDHRAVLVGDEIHIRDGNVWLGAEHAQTEGIGALITNEKFSSREELNEAVYQHFTNPPQRPERFSLNLDSLQWRRLPESN